MYLCTASEIMVVSMLYLSVPIQSPVCNRNLSAPSSTFVYVPFLIPCILRPLAINTIISCYRNLSVATNNCVNC